MPLTQAYTEQLTKLSTMVEAALNELYQESLVMFADKLGVKLSESEELKALLSRPCGELTPEEITTLKGKDKSKSGSRQRLFLLHQAWNGIVSLNAEIQAHETTTAETLAEKMTLMLALFQSAVTYAIDSFNNHELTDRKIDFVKSFINLADRLLQKQLTIQIMLATNTPIVVPEQPKDDVLNNPRKAYNEAVAEFNRKHLATLTQYEAQLSTINLAIKKIDTLCSSIAETNTAMSTPSEETNKLETSISREKDDLKTLAFTHIDDNATLKTLKKLDDDIAAGSTKLNATMGDYQTKVIDVTTLDPSAENNLASLIQTINSTREALINNNIEEEEKQTLTTLYDALIKSIDDLKKTLSDHNTALNEIKTQHERDKQAAEAAYPTHAALLSDTANDNLALATFKTACTKQIDKTSIKSWENLAESLTEKFNRINEKYEENHRRLPIHPPGPSIDTNIIDTLTEAIKTTEKQITALKKDRDTTQSAHEKKCALLNRDHDSALQAQQIAMDTARKKCEEALAKLKKETQALFESRTKNKDEAYDAIQHASQKRVEIASKTDALEAKTVEVEYLKKRLKTLQATLNEHGIVVKRDEINPTLMLEKLNALPITLGLIRQDSVLNQMKRKTDELDYELAYTMQSHNGRNNGTLAGGLASSALSLLLLTGLILSVYFSFGLTTPFIIAAGVAIATSPAIGSAIGRLFGWHKDKVTFKKTLQNIHQNNQTMREKVSNDNKTKNAPRKLTRQKSLMLQASFISPNDPAFDALLAAATNQNARPINPQPTLHVSELLDPKNYQFTNNSQSLAHIDTSATTAPNAIHPDENDIVHPSYNPRLFGQTSEPDDAPKPRKKHRPKRKTVQFSPAEENNANAGSNASQPSETGFYAFPNHHEFEDSTVGYESPLNFEQAQGEASKPVFANTHRPG